MTKTAPFIIYNASAGSGKTFSLAQNYISHLLTASSDFEFKHILAITFTNKAVAEMKQRIITSLRDFSKKTIPDNSKGLFEKAKEQTGLTPNEIQKKSKRILKTILHNYSGFEISTIDSFNQRILKTFAKDLKIPVNFEITLDTDEVLEEAVDRVIAQIGENKILTEALINFALNKADDNRSWDISYDLNEIAKLLINENNFKSLKKIEDKSLKDFADFEKKIREEINQHQKINVARAEKFFALLDREGLEPSDFMNRWLPNFIKKVLDKKDVIPKGTKWQIKVKEGIVEYPKRVSAEKQSAIEQIQPEITQLYTSIEASIFKIVLFKEILKKSPALSLLAAIRNEVENIKSEQGILLISEFNKIINESIKDQPVPFIYERLGEWYKTYYIDEFQDTSELQWKNIQPLIDHSLSSGEGQLTLLGDAKQSIYRWRGGRAEQFIDLSNDYNPFYTEKRIKKLGDNWRSSPEIVNFNNEFFGYIKKVLENETYYQLYEEVAQNPQKQNKGYVNIKFLDTKTADEKDELYPEEVLAILNRLKTHQNQPEKHTHLNGVCVLVRTQKQGVAIAQYLSEHDIPIISSETLLLENSKEVLFLISLLKFILNPQDNNFKFEVLHYLYEKLEPKETLYQFIYDRKELSIRKTFESINIESINFDLKQFNQLPLYESLEYSIRAFQLMEDANAYVQFFLDFVYDYVQSDISGINGLLELWDLKKEKLSITVPKGQNAVQIMTIHKAKGLEFPTVIYPYADLKINDTSKDQIWVDLKSEPNDIRVAHLHAGAKLKNLEDDIPATFQKLIEETILDTLNVAYVAMTRAEKQLFIISSLKHTSGDKSDLYLSGLLYSFLREKEQWQVETNSFEYGELLSAEEVATSKKEDQIVNVSLKKFVSSNPAKHDIHIMTKSGNLWGSAQEKAIEEGNIIHQLLSQIYSHEDAERVIENAITDGVISHDEREKYLEKIGHVVFHPKLMPFFSSNCDFIFTEKEIITNNSLKRLDRLSITDNKAVIIDYKTGDFNSAHENQITAYGKAIKDMGYEVYQQLLIYFREDGIEIKKIP